MTKKVVKRKRGQRAGIRWDKEKRLGKMPDKKLADILGVDPNTVRSARIFRDIPGFHASQQDKPKKSEVITVQEAAENLGVSRKKIVQAQNEQPRAKRKSVRVALRKNRIIKIYAKRLFPATNEPVPVG